MTLEEPTLKNRSGCLISIFVAGLFGIFVIVPGIQHARESARRSQCTFHLKFLHLALSSYERTHETLPPRVYQDSDGKPLYSWRLDAMRYNYYDRDLDVLFDKSLSWDSAENSKSDILELEWPSCPNREDITSQTSTTYFAVAAENSVWQNHSYKLDDLPDGPENTLLIIELDIPGVHWLEPKDVSLNELLTVLKEKGEIPSPHDDVVLMCFADGKVYQVPQEKITPEFLKAIVSIDGREAMPPFLEEARMGN